MPDTRLTLKLSRRDAKFIVDWFRGDADAITESYPDFLDYDVTEATQRRLYNVANRIEKQIAPTP